MILQKRICASFHPKYKVKFYFCYTIVYMVRIINGKNVKSLANITYKILRIQEKFTHIEEFNNLEFLLVYMLFGIQTNFWCTE